MRIHTRASISGIAISRTEIAGPHVICAVSICVPTYAADARKFLQKFNSHVLHSIPRDLHYSGKLKCLQQRQFSVRHRKKRKHSPIMIMFFYNCTAAHWQTYPVSFSVRIVRRAVWIILLQTKTVVTEFINYWWNIMDVLHCVECNMTFFGTEEILYHEPMESAITFPRCQKRYIARTTMLYMFYCMIQ